MKIIVGLGNPGIKYAGTRHNTGFSVVIGISDKYGIPFNKKECKSVTGHGIIAGEKVVIAQPQTYMNLSGEAVQELLHFYKCSSKDLIVIYDDVEFDVGRMRIRAKGSAGGHNGIKSIISHTGTQNFKRIRIGVGAKPAGMDLADYVLGRFSTSDRKSVEESYANVNDAVELMIREDINAAMNQYN